MKATPSIYMNLRKRIVQLGTYKNLMFTILSMQLITSVICVHVWNNKIKTKIKRVSVPKEENGDILEKAGYYNQNGDESSNTSFRHEYMLLLSANVSSEKFFKINRQSTEISCSKLFKAEKDEQERANQIMESVQEPQEMISPEEYINMTSNCSKFIHDRGYIMNSVTKEEEQFPIAFSILMYKDPWQFERLLRAIYRPQNPICIHVDGKTNGVIFKAVSGISHCLDNVFIASKRIKVEWGTYTVLEPDLVCMRDLWNRSKTWKYFINLTGQEFPLRTNYELVKILKIYNGTNAIDSTYNRAQRGRWQSAGPPPYGVKLIKGSVHIAASRAFVGYTVNDERATAVLQWTRRTRVPDEHFFQILNFNPVLDAPGFYRGVPETYPGNRFKNWRIWPCAGKYVRNICIFGIGDLPLLEQRKELFVNKFHMDYQRLALDCMEELHFNRTLDQYLGKTMVDFGWYSTLPHVKNQHM